MVIKSLPRKFGFKNGNEDLTLDDPNPNMSADEVLTFFSNAYPALTNATVSGPKVENDAVNYKFETTVGTKG